MRDASKLVAKRCMFLLAACSGFVPCVFAATALPSRTAAAASRSDAEVRIGIVAYEDFHRELAIFEDVFRKLSRKAPDLTFQIAVGSYGEVQHWLERGHIDLAVLTPGVFAELLAIEEGSGAQQCRYLATIQLPAATSEWASADRRRPGRYESYGAVCLVAETSALRTADDLRAAAQNGTLEYLFVHPLSVSGRAAPMHALSQMGIEPAPENTRFTYSHSQSIRTLRSSSRVDRRQVAFVWDDAAGNDPQLSDGIRRLPMPALESLRIPHDVVVSRPGFRHHERIQTLLLADDEQDSHYRFTRTRDWQAQFKAVRSWLVRIHDSKDIKRERASLDEIGHMLLQYSRSQPNPPRLALVLSGGGAKCSYQVGAVGAIEEKLRELRNSHPDYDLDIGLVVGTSGGAINSLPIAMGVTRTQAGREAFGDTWRKLDQRDIVRPSVRVRANMGLWFALLQISVIVFVLRRLIRQPARRVPRFAQACMVLGVLGILFSMLPGVPWSWLGSSHLIHHAWLWLSFGLLWSAWSLLAMGVVTASLLLQAAKKGFRVVPPAWFTKTTLVAGLLGLPLLQFVTILGYEQTLSGGQGMEAALARRIPEVINRHLALQDQPPLQETRKVSRSERLQEISRQILDRRLLQRDLVITGSCLSQSAESLPSDLYFYAAASSDNDPPYGERGLSLADRPHVLLDVVLGSGSIFPVFPPRKIADIPRAGEEVELVDGGFAHNSPVEAAVLWGATHIISIEATPHQRSERGNFLRNASSSFRHLHRQAQLLDARSRDKVVIFTLAPQSPHICVLDFSSNLIDASIQRGYRDANLDAAASKPRFEKELGEPAFLNVP